MYVCMYNIHTYSVCYTYVLYITMNDHTYIRMYVCMYRFRVRGTGGAPPTIFTVVRTCYSMLWV